MIRPLLTAIAAALVLGSCSQSTLLSEIKSEVALAQQSIAAPDISPAGGNFLNQPNVTLTNFPPGGEVIFTTDGSNPVYNSHGNTRDTTFSNDTGSIWLSPTMGSSTLKVLYYLGGHFSPLSTATFRLVGDGGPKVAWAGAGTPGGQVTCVTTASDGTVWAGGTLAGQAFVAGCQPGGALGTLAVLTGGPAVVTGVGVNTTMGLVVVIGTLTAATVTNYTFGTGPAMTSGSSGSTGFIAILNRATMTCTQVLTTAQTISATFTGLALGTNAAFVAANFNGPGSTQMGTGGPTVSLARTGSNGVFLTFSYTSALFCQGASTSGTPLGTDWFNAIAYDSVHNMVGIAGGYSPAGAGLVYGSSTVPGAGTFKTPLAVIASTSGAFTAAVSPVTTGSLADGDLLAATFDASGDLLAGGYQTGSSTGWNGYTGVSAGKNAMLATVSEGGSVGVVSGPAVPPTGDSWVQGLNFDQARGLVFVVGTLAAGASGWAGAGVPSLPAQVPFVAQFNSFATGPAIAWIRCPDSAGNGLTYQAVGTTIVDPTNNIQTILPVVGTATGGSALSLGLGYSVTPAVPGNNLFLSWIYE